MLYEARYRAAELRRESGSRSDQTETTYSRLYQMIELNQSECSGDENDI